MRSLFKFRTRSTAVRLSRPRPYSSAGRDASELFVVHTSPLVAPDVLLRERARAVMPDSMLHSFAPMAKQAAHAANNEQGKHPHRPDGGRDLTRQAISATLHCLTGCAIGEILGMVLATWWGWANVPSVTLSVALAFLFGYLLTMRPVLRAGVGLRRALGVALAADTVSIAVMEIVDNAFILAVPGAIAATLSDALFWWSLGLSLVIAFAVAVPVNRLMIARGRGHAVVHPYHH